MDTKKAICLAAVLATVLVTKTTFAQDNESPARRWSLGMTRNQATIFVIDANSPMTATQQVGVAGIQFTHAMRPQHLFDILTDVEIQLGLLERGSTMAVTTTHLVGAHASAGPRINIPGIPLAIHVLGGMSTLHLTGDRVTTGGLGRLEHLLCRR